MKLIIRGQEARNKLLEGAKLMYDCVATTYGPKGRNVGLARAWGFPLSVHDGVTVAREVESDDEFLQMAILYIKEAAQKTNQLAGDGTTGSTLLAYHLVDKGMKLLEAGINPMVLRTQLEEASKLVLEKLKTMSTPTESKEDIERIAFVSSGDKQIGEKVAEAIDHVGRDGLVTVEEGKSGEITVDYTEGMEFDRGYSHPLFVTNPNRMEAVIRDAAVVVIGKKITMQREIVPLLETIAQTNKNIALFGDISGEALNMALVNKQGSVLNIVVCDVPGTVDRRQDFLEDIAIMTGGSVVSDELGMEMEQFAHQFDRKWIGGAKAVIANKEKTMIIEGKGDKKAIEERIAQLRGLRDEQEKNNLEFERERYEERLAKFTTGVGIVRVGAKTDVELREKVERVKDAIGAARATLDEGVVPGGGVAFVKASRALDGMETEGAKLLQEILGEPTKKLLINAGESEEKIEELIKEIGEKGGNFGYNVNTGNIEDLVESGVIDPTKVLRLALENGVSVAGTMLTTDCLIANKNEKPQNNEQQ